MPWPATALPAAAAAADLHDDVVGEVVDVPEVALRDEGMKGGVVDEGHQHLPHAVRLASSVAQPPEGAGSLLQQASSS
jgi:hypothetical protein